MLRFGDRSFGGGSHEIVVRVIVEVIGASPTQIPLTTGLARGMPVPVSAERATDLSGDGADARGVVAGKIDTTNELDLALAGWFAYLDEHKARSTALQWRNIARADVRRAGWRALADINYAAILEHLTRQKREREWNDRTYRAHVACWRAFDKHLKRTRAGDVQALEGPRAGDDDPARAGTTDEARAHLAALLEGEKDGRCQHPRFGYVAAQYLAACRVSEPHNWTWDRVYLDEPVPFIEWQRGWHKANRRATVALAPELVIVLRWWRAVCFPGGGAEGQVFPEKPKPGTWHTDRIAAEIDLRDRFGRKYTGGSARKWHRTALMEHGVTKELADFLVRHKTDVGDYYKAPSLSVQAEGLAKLPKILPPQAPCFRGVTLSDGGPDVKITPSLIAGAENTRYLVVPEVPAMVTTSTSISTPGPSPSTGPCGRLRNDRAEGPGLSCCFVEGPLSPSSLDWASRFGAGNERSLPRSAGPIAALLRSLADLMDGHDGSRKGASHDQAG